MVERDRDVVGRGGPREVDLGRAGRARVQARGRRRRLGVGRRGSGRARRRRVVAEAGHGVLGAHAVRVGGGGSEARVREGRRGGRPDLREVRAARAGAALDVVERDRDVVGRGGPREVDLGRAGRARVQARGRRRRLGVGRRGSGRARRVRVGACVAGSVDGPKAVGVRGRRVEEDVHARRRRAERDLRKVGAARARAALDLVVSHADVIRRRAPGQLDLAAREGTRGQRPGRARILGVGRWVAHGARPEVVEPPSRAADPDSAEAGARVGRVLDEAEARPGRTVVAPGLERRALGPQQHRVTDSELLRRGEQRGEAAVGDPVDRRLVGSRLLADEQHVAVVGGGAGDCTRAYRRIAFPVPAASRAVPRTRRRGRTGRCCARPCRWSWPSRRAGWRSR